jgi:UDP-N-acetylmuramate--alanine ligase
MVKQLLGMNFRSHITSSKWRRYCYGIVQKITPNLIGNGKRSSLEADEFDRSVFTFASKYSMWLNSSMDADHLISMVRKDAIEASFIEFASKVEDKNKLFMSA